MRNFYIAILSSLFLFSCSGDDNTVIPIVNTVPSIPSLVFPTNNLVCTNFNLEFDWGAAVDSDGDSIRYTIDIATDTSFGTILFTATTNETIQTFTLEKGTTYFWRVKASDSAGNESEYSDVQTFFTEPDAGVNTIPNAPLLTSPSLGDSVSGTNITLDWDATDGDNDPLTFDLYFGDTNPPVLVSEDMNVSTFDVTISTNTTYYWRVVVKDDKQGATIGQIWNFRTE
ncbi:fibronectin type III domain-containing protein [Aquimarina megaterium]|uniref:hypothetical protein n=1 Tax=Aquimarina megaterium TaxID=1443666 RepID=UPI00046EAE5C|nr:hypothetical protein [Aquimarina megaterium]